MYQPARPLMYAELSMSTPSRHLSAPTDAAVEQSVPALVDTGANISVISDREVARLGLELIPSAKGRVIKLGKGCCRAGGSVLLRDCTLEGRAVAKIRLTVVEGLNQRVVLGMDVLGREGIVLDCERGAVAFRPDVSGPGLIDSPNGLTVLDDDEDAAEYEFFYVTAKDILQAGGLDDNEEDLPNQQAVSAGDSATGQPVITDARMQQIIDDHSRVFQKRESLPGRRGLYDFAIDLYDDARPERRTLYRLSTAETKALRAEVMGLLDRGWIARSHSAWSSPVLFAKNRKKDGSLRPVYDYRSINSRTVPFNGPLPRWTEILPKLRGAAVFSVFDLAKGFQQIRVRAGDEPKTAFATPWGLYHHLVMTMGSANAAAHMQSVGNAMIEGDAEALPEFPVGHPLHDLAEENLARYSLERGAARRQQRRRDGRDEIARIALDSLGSFIILYVDDIIVYSADREAHYGHVEALLERLELFDLRLNEFSRFGESSVEFLGFTISRNEVRVKESRVQSILDWPVPTSAAAVRTFLGLVNFYRDHHLSYATWAAQLTPLTGKGVPWRWTAQHDRAFAQIKEGIAARIALRLPDPDRPFVLATDASLHAVGGVLLQADPDAAIPDRLEIVACFSKQCSPAEGRYSQHSLEMLALVRCITHWRWLLDGATDLVIYTDSKALVTGKLFSESQPSWASHRMARWIARIASTRADLRHHPASARLAVAVDALTRRPDYVNGTAKDMDGWIRELSELHAARKQRAQQTQSMQVMSGIAATPQGAKCMYTLVVAESPLARIKAGTLGSDDRQMQRLGCEWRDGIWTRFGRIVVPLDAALRADLIREVHDVGHPGRLATCQMLRRRYWWPRMIDDVAEFIKQCATCSHVKSGRRHGRGSHPLPLATEVWSEVQLDFIVSLPPSGPRGFTRICTVSCRRSKEVILIPCWDAMTAADFADLFLDYVWKTKGMPRVVRTDHDPLFISQLWRRFAARLGFAATQSAPYRHQQMGGVERVNQHVEQLLRTWVASQEARWSEYLPMVQFALNYTPASTLGISPFEVVQGWLPRRGFDASDDVPLATTSLDPGQRAAEVIQWVNERLMDSEIHNTRSGSTWRPGVGDRVYLSSEHLSAKTVGVASDSRLRDRWVGPYVVVGLDDNTEAVHVELPLRWQVQQPISLDRLKPCFLAGLPPVQVEVDPDTGTKYVVAEVERIVGHTCSGRGRNRVVATLTVRFAGYEADFDRVYSIDGDDAIAGLLDTSAGVVQDYLEQHGLRLPPDLQKCLTAECAFLELDPMDVPWMFSVEAVV